MSINTTPSAPVKLNGEPLAFVEDYAYLGILISKYNGAQKRQQRKTGKSPLCFCQSSDHMDVKTVCHENKVKILQQ